MVDLRATVGKQRSAQKEHEARPVAQRKSEDSSISAVESLSESRSAGGSAQRITAEQLAAATRLREYWMQRSLARYDGDKHARESSSDPAFDSLGGGSPALEEYQYNFAKGTDLVAPNNSTHGRATDVIQSSE